MPADHRRMAHHSTRPRRDTAARCLTLAALLVLAVAGLGSAAAADRALRVAGPSQVRVGQEVRFPTTGFKARERITVNLAPTINRGGNCCGIDVITRARADTAGKAVLHWRWPSYYFNGDQRKPWVNGSRVDVIVLTPSFARGRKVVRVYR
jgi:hypothetical protein